MRRTLEKLAQQRKEKEEDFSKKLDEIKKKSKKLPDIRDFTHLRQALSRLNDTIQAGEISGPRKNLVPSSGAEERDFPQDAFQPLVLVLLNEFQAILEKNLTQTKEMITSFAELIQSATALADARDKEWDALGSNHMAMIFKSVEWRVEKLAVHYEDISLLMKKFLLLKEKLNRMLFLLEKGDLPSSSQVKEIVQALEDWRYAGFENRYRGSEEDIIKQQSAFIPYFKTKGMALDLGCGRGEFLGLLKENGIDARGIDINGQMIDICRDKALDCQKKDILQALAEIEDNSLGGIFSSQVVEHLSPEYLKRMIELAFLKIAPGGRIVLETINPASVFALVEIYFLDLSHEKPLHPQALRFLLESSGFEEVEIKYSAPMQEEQLQNLPGSDEMSSLLNRNIDSLNKLLYAPPNYAAIGLKR
jgi:SAM-dependent methyltransferase